MVGLAAKWVLAREVEAPPATPEALAGILGIQAERVFSMNADELVFDYCGKTSTSEKSQVLLLAARRQIVDRIKELGRGGGPACSVDHRLGVCLRQRPIRERVRLPLRAVHPAHVLRVLGPVSTAARDSSSTSRW